MLILIFIVCFFYFLNLLIFAIGYLYSEKSDSRIFPDISILIAARNEEENIGECIASLLNLDYPPEKIEIIIADDNSNDNTPKIILGFASKYKHIKYFAVTPELDNLKGKMNAISQAISRSYGEIIFITDADCSVNKSWIKDTLKYYNENTGLVCGITSTGYHSIFQGIQSLDWIFHLFLAAGSFGLNMPYSCAGNNMSFRRKAYEETGGYKKLGFSYTEDVKLLQAISANTDWKCRFALEKGNLIRTKGVKNLKDMINQKMRWAARNRMDTGGKNSPLPILISFFLSSLIYPLIYIAPFLSGNIFTGFLPLFVKAICDFLFLLIPFRIFRLYSILKYFIIFELYFIIYVPILPILVIFRNNMIWKERIYNLKIR